MIRGAYLGTRGAPHPQTQPGRPIPRRPHHCTPHHHWWPGRRLHSARAQRLRPHPAGLATLQVALKDRIAAHMTQDGAGGGRAGWPPRATRLGTPLVRRRQRQRQQRQRQQRQRQQRQRQRYAPPTLPKPRGAAGRVARSRSCRTAGAQKRCRPAPRHGATCRLGDHGLGAITHPTQWPSRPRTTGHTAAHPSLPATCHPSPASHPPADPSWLARTIRAGYTPHRPAR